MSAPVQVRAEVLQNQEAGAYRHLMLHAPGIAAQARPGQFVACTVGGEESGLLLRRSFSLHRADPGSGTVEVIVAAHGPGTRWITERAPGLTLDVVGPLGRGFVLPREPVATVLVGGGYGAAPLGWLAQMLRAGGCRVDVVVGAGDAGRLFGQHQARRLADSVTVTTDDGSAGTRGRVTDVMPELMRRHATSVVYACGPMAMLRAVHEVARAEGASSQLAVEESMACGIGVCMTCVLPVRDPDGVTRMARACLEGPVFGGEALRWDAISAAGSAVPDDCLGAPVSSAPATQAPVSGAPGSVTGGRA